MGRILLALASLLCVCPTFSSIRSNTATVALTLVVPETASATIIHAGTNLFNPTLISANWNLAPDANRVVSVEVCEDGVCHIEATNQQLYCTGELPCRILQARDQILIASTARSVDVKVQVL